MVDHSCIKVETVLGPMLTESHNEFGVPGAKMYNSGGDGPIANMLSCCDNILSVKLIEKRFHSGMALKIIIVKEICLRMVSAPDTIDADAVDAIYKAFKAVLLMLVQSINAVHLLKCGSPRFVSFIASVRPAIGKALLYMDELIQDCATQRVNHPNHA